ncbi:MAG: hypothetical protein ABSC42_05995 [Tepidisphaeraceae bacterium]|jgi:hypothetical protein
MTRLAGILVLTLLASCAGAGPSAGIDGPTGRAGDARSVSSVDVRDTWKMDLAPQSQDMVTKKLTFPKTARFDEKVHFEAYYDAEHDVTRLGVYGNVKSSSDYGTSYNNGYYVTWEETGRADSDFPPPWRLVDVEVMDLTY